jgi:DNA-directed RNA polymerase beta subunit
MLIGYNQEDSIIINQSSIDRVFLEVYTYELIKLKSKILP